MASKRPTKAAVQRRVKYWKPRLMLHHWNLSVVFDPDTEDGSEASCNASPEYLNAVLRFDLNLIPPAEMDSYIVHEMLHCSIWPLANCAHSMCGEDAAKLESVRVHEEALATCLERIIIGLTEGAA